MDIKVEKKRVSYLKKIEEKYKGKSIVFEKVADYEMKIAVEELAKKFNLARS